MRKFPLVSASAMAIVLAATMTSVSASNQPATPRGTAVIEVTTATPTPAVESQSHSSQFATLKDVKAIPMAAKELEAVKGLHIHFVTPGGFHLVNHRENNLGNGQAKPGSGPGYSGLCGAALNSPAIVIPGQNTTTGIGGGC